MRYKENKYYNYVLLLLWGLGSSWFILYNQWIFHPERENIRTRYMLQWIEAFREGRVAPEGFLNTDHSVGLYFYGGLLSRFFHISNPNTVFIAIQIVAAAFLLIVFPLEIYVLSSSYIAALVSPFIVDAFVGAILYANKTEVAWSSVWIVVIALPVLLYLFDQTLGKRYCQWYLWACFLISLANIVRAHSSFPIAVILLLIHTKKLIDTRQKRKQLVQILLLYVVLFIAYNFFGTTIPQGIGKINHQEISSVDDTIWPNMYIGFGYLDNPYGLYYSDQCTYDIAAAENPDLEGGTREFNLLFKSLVFDLIQKDPVFCIKTVFIKFIDTFRLEMDYLKSSKLHYRYIVMFIVAVMVCLLHKKHLIQKGVVGFFMMSLICYICGKAQSVLAVPRWDYSYQSIGTIGVFFAGMGIAVLVMLTNDKES